MVEIEQVAESGINGLEAGKRCDLVTAEAQADTEQPRKLEVFDPGYEVLSAYDEWDWA